MSKWTFWRLFYSRILFRNSPLLVYLYPLILCHYLLIFVIYHLRLLSVFIHKVGFLSGMVNSHFLVFHLLPHQRHRFTTLCYYFIISSLFLFVLLLACSLYLFSFCSTVAFIAFIEFKQFYLPLSLLFYHYLHLVHLHQL